EGAAEGGERAGEPGNDIARKIAKGRDPEWDPADEDAWVVLLEAHEEVVDEWVLEDESVRGYAPYLMEPENAAAEPRRLRGVLRGDVVKRRKPKRFDTGMPS